MGWRTGIFVGVAGLALVVCANGVCAEAAEKAAIPEEFDGLPLVFSQRISKRVAQWTPTDPKAWKILEEDGNHVYALVSSSDYKPPVRSPLSISLLKDVEVSDFVFEAKMKQAGREYGHRDICVFFGHTDASHFYYVHIATKADAHANSIFIVNGEPRLSIATERTDGTDWATGYHQVRVTCNSESGKIQVFFDDMDTPIMVAEDKTFPSGKVGFGSFDDVGNIDDVRLWGTKK